MLTRPSILSRLALCYKLCHHVVYIKVELCIFRYTHGRAYYAASVLGGEYRITRDIYLVKPVLSIQQVVK